MRYVPLFVSTLVVARSPSGRTSHFTARGGGADSRCRNSRLMGVASQIFAVRSPLPVTIRDPSGLNDAEKTPRVCPLRVSRSEWQRRWTYRHFPAAEVGPGAVEQGHGSGDV